jgi:DNA-binding NarL/FixJ family response regulator
MNNGVISVLVVDDHKLVCQGICALLQLEPKLRVAGQAADADEAIRLTLQLSPEVALLDYSLPGIEGDQVIRRLRRDCPEVKILVLSCHADAWHIEQSFRAGASGYMTKFTEASDLFHGIRAVACGEIFLGGEARRIWNGRAEQELSQHQRGSLSRRQREVLRLIAQGRVNREIAVELSLSIKTVEKHRQELMKKVDIHSAAGLTRYAVESGIIPLGCPSSDSHEAAVPLQ